MRLVAPGGRVVLVDSDAAHGDIALVLLGVGLGPAAERSEVRERRVVVVVGVPLHREKYM